MSWLLGIAGCAFSSAAQAEESPAQRARPPTPAGEHSAVDSGAHAAKLPSRRDSAAAAEGAGAAAAGDPYLFALREGDAAYLARDFAAALQHYSAAIKEQPRRAAAHFRMGEVLRAQGKFDDALEALGNAARFAKRIELQARAVFAMADTFERKNQLSRAAEEWGVYLEIVEKHATMLAAKSASARADDPIFEASARERLSQIAAAIERIEAYAAVRARIERREAELDERSRGQQQQQQKE